MNENKLNKLNELLLDCLVTDLDDPQKCTPGLYQVVRGVLNDNKEEEDAIPRETIEILENRLSSAIPFNKELGT